MKVTVGLRQASVLPKKPNQIGREPVTRPRTELRLKAADRRLIARAQIESPLRERMRLNAGGCTTSRAPFWRGQAA